MALGDSFLDVVIRRTLTAMPRTADWREALACELRRKWGGERVHIAGALRRQNGLGDAIERVKLFHTARLIVTPA